MSETVRAKSLAELTELQEKPGGGHVLRVAIAAFGGAIPMVGSTVGGLWGLLAGPPEGFPIHRPALDPANLTGLGSRITHSKLKRGANESLITTVRAF